MALPGPAPAARTFAFGLLPGPPRVVPCRAQRLTRDIRRPRLGTRPGSGSFRGRIGRGGPRRARLRAAGCSRPGRRGRRPRALRRVGGVARARSLRRVGDAGRARDPRPAVRLGGGHAVPPTGLVGISGTPGTSLTNAGPGRIRVPRRAGPLGGVSRPEGTGVP
ncbi:hypothetical protein [Streptomyces iakyrus]|uniref:hypothetical protein n=1 Tax=Streptomyces iakyrus TaxID=68219 RepID=UPI003D902ED1